MVSQKWLVATVAASCAVAITACARVHDNGKPNPGASGAGTSGHGKRAADAGKEVVAAVGTSAVAKLDPVAAEPDSMAQTDPAMPSAAPRPVMGTATFTQRQEGVNLALNMTGCDMTKSYPVFIQQGMDCEEATLMGPHWNPPRGEDISNVTCFATGPIGRVYYRRENADAKPWTIGGAAASDIVGHALVLYASDMPLRPVACGVIMLGEAPPSLDAGTGDAHVPPLEVRAQLGGICLARMIVRDNTQDCPDPAQFEACVKDNCNLSQCISQCASYVACLETSADVCDLTCSQLLDKPCSDCTGSLRTCALGFCANQFSCASPPAPDGPCAELEACCGMQGDSAASCLETVHAIERLSGDPSCYGIMRDWGATPHFPVPCDFEK